MLDGGGDNFLCETQMKLKNIKSNNGTAKHYQEFKCECVRAMPTYNNFIFIWFVYISVVYHRSQTMPTFSNPPVDLFYS